MMRFVNVDVFMYALITAARKLDKEKMPEKAKMVREIASRLQADLNEVTVDVCPICGERFDGGAE